MIRSIDSFCVGAVTVVVSILTCLGSAHAAPLVVGCYRGSVSGTADLAATCMTMKVQGSSQGRFVIKEKPTSFACGTTGEGFSETIAYRVRRNGGNYVATTSAFAAPITSATISLRQLQRSAKDGKNKISYARREIGYVGAGGGTFLQRDVTGTLTKTTADKCR